MRRQKSFGEIVAGLALGRSKPRKKRGKATPEAQLLFVLLVVLGCCWLIVQLLLKNPSVVVVLGLATAAIVVAIVVVRAVRRRSLFDKANTAIEQNAEHLARRRAQLVRRDAYGKLILDKWADEVNYFIDRHIHPLLKPQEQSLLLREREQIAEIIMQRVDDVARGKPLFEAFSGNMTPTEFEVFCAEQLRQSGWDAHVTQGSRDQGVDVVAQKNGVRIVLQCKLYSGPVGNKAVQEAVAARAFERADYCAVVSNSSYTSPAEQLAETNAVLLLHYSDLTRIETLLPKTKAPR